MPPGFSLPLSAPLQHASRVLQAAAWVLARRHTGIPRGWRLEGPPDWQPRRAPMVRHRHWILLASGPSVAHFDVAQAQKAGFAILAVNGGYRLLRAQQVQADLLMLTDPHAARDYGREASQWARETWISSYASHAANWRPDRGGVFLQWANPHISARHFETDPLRPFFHAYSVVHPALQMCVALGGVRIGMVGVDLTTDPRHLYGVPATPAEEERAVRLFHPSRDGIRAGLDGARAWLRGHRPEIGVWHITSPEPSCNPFAAISWSCFAAE